MNKREIKALMADIAPVIREYVGASVEPVTRRLDAIERRFADLPAPVNGKDADPDAVAGLVILRLEPQLDEMRRALDEIEPSIATAIATLVEAFPAPVRGQDGAPGRDGKSVTVDDVAPLIESVVAKSIAALPVTKDGALGPVGPAGKDGAQGPPGPAGEPGKDGAAGDVGMDGTAGMDGKDGAPGRDGSHGEDGIGMAGAMIGRDGNLVVTLTDGTHRDLGPVIGKDGAPGAAGMDGKAGVDGIGFENLSAEYDGDRKLTLKFTRGDEIKVFAFDLPLVIDRGVFKPDQSYKKGDGATWGGSFWIAQQDTSARPGDSPDWRLAVKRGRDGREVVSVPRDDKQPVKINGNDRA